MSVGKQDMLHALRADDMVMFIGLDQTGHTLIEVGVVIWWGGELAIAHAFSPERATFLR